MQAKRNEPAPQRRSSDAGTACDEGRIDARKTTLNLGACGAVLGAQDTVHLARYAESGLQRPTAQSFLMPRRCLGSFGFGIFLWTTVSSIRVFGYSPEVKSIFTVVDFSSHFSSVQNEMMA